MFAIYALITAGYPTISHLSRVAVRSIGTFTITELGLSLIPIIDQMLTWGAEHYDIFEKKYGKKHS